MLKELEDMELPKLTEEELQALVIAILLICYFWNLNSFF